MELKWKLSVLGLLVLGAVLSAGAAISSFAVAQSQREAQVQLPEVSQQYISYDTAAYILKESDGYVAVFSSNSETPPELTNIPVSGLRQADQALLKQGITAADRQAVLALLEDLGS